MNYAKYMMMEIKRIGTHARGKSSRVGWVRPAGYVTNSASSRRSALCLLQKRRKSGLRSTKFGKGLKFA